MKFNHLSSSLVLLATLSGLATATAMRGNPPLQQQPQQQQQNLQQNQNFGQNQNNLGQNQNRNQQQQPGGQPAAIPNIPSVSNLMNEANNNSNDPNAPNNPTPNLTKKKIAVGKVLLHADNEGNLSGFSVEKTRPTLENPQNEGGLNAAESMGKKKGAKQKKHGSDARPSPSLNTGLLVLTMVSAVAFQFLF